MKSLPSLSWIAALGTGVGLLTPALQPVQAQTFTRSISTPVGQTRTLTREQNSRTSTWTRPDGRTYSRETNRYDGGRSRVFYGPSGGSFNREYSREDGTKSTSFTGPDGRTRSRSTAFDGQGNATRTVVGPDGRTETRTVDITN
jgi:uncharacterized protein YfaP (DUF2135 family)